MIFSVYQLPDEYLENVMVDHDGCWIWLGQKNNNGYGVSSWALVHRMAFICTVGMIPKDMTLDHLCRRKACLNPNHLEVVTRGENSRRVLAPVPYRFIEHPSPFRWAKDFDQDQNILRPLRPPVVDPLASTPHSRTRKR